MLMNISTYLYNQWKSQNLAQEHEVGQCNYLCGCVRALWGSRCDWSTWSSGDTCCSSVRCEPAGDAASCWCARTSGHICHTCRASLWCGSARAWLGYQCSWTVYLRVQCRLEGRVWTGWVVVREYAWHYSKRARFRFYCQEGAACIVNSNNHWTVGGLIGVPSYHCKDHWEQSPWN